MPEYIPRHLCRRQNKTKKISKKIKITNTREDEDYDEAILAHLRHLNLAHLAHPRHVNVSWCDEDNHINKDDLDVSSFNILSLKHPLTC